MTPQRRLRIAEAHGWVCHFCETKIDPVRDRWEVSHPLALELGGSDDDEDLRPAHYRCHRWHTANKDAPLIAKAKRQMARYLGTKTRKGRPLPGGRDSPLKKKLTGEVVER